jgi:hypothetical protein
MSTPNLAIVHIVASQNNKEVTANTAFDDLDVALTDLLVKALPADADYTFSSAEALTHMVIQVTGTISALRHMIVPTNKKLYAVMNNTTGGFALVFKTASGTGVNVPVDATKYTWIYCDGTNVVPLAVPTSGTSISLGGTNVQTGNYSIVSGDTGKAVILNSASAATFTLLNPPPSSTFVVFIYNMGTGVLTVSRNSLTINGRSHDLTLDQGDAAFVFTDGTNYYTVAARIMSLGVFMPGTGSNNQVLLYLALDRACVFPASAPNAQAVASVAATGSTTYTFKKNGTSFATVNFAASATSGTWTQAADAIFAPGDILEIDGPATADTTLANMGLTLQGYRF